MNSLVDCYKLAGGVEIPCIGYGTYRAADGDETIEAVRCALTYGYRHIDTAQAYGNEESVGQAIKQSGIDRKEIFLTSKLANPDHGYEKTMAAFEQSLRKLQTDYLDLYLIHWPNPIDFRHNWQEANAGTWKAFEELYHAGRIKAIGVSNFHRHHIEALLRTASIAPMVNQIRLCPGDTQEEVVAYCRSRDMVLEAYSPLGVGKTFEVPEIRDIARKYDKSVAQICIRWSLERGYLPLPKSVTPARIQSNTEVFDFKMEEEDIRLMAELTGCAGLAPDPDTITW